MYLQDSDFYEKELEEVAPIHSKAKSYGSENTNNSFVKMEVRFSVLYRMNTNTPKENPPQSTSTYIAKKI